MKNLAPRFGWLMPFVVLACCFWIALWPRARAMVVESRAGTSSMPMWNYEIYSVDPNSMPDDDPAQTRLWMQAKRNFPADADVQILARENIAPLQALVLIEKRLQRAPNDLFWLSYYAHLSTNALQPVYGTGPLNNPNWPQKSNYSAYSPRGTPAQWQQLERLALRGAALEPDNGFWTWMRARALVGSKRERELGALFRGAARNTRFDAREREQQIWRFATTRRALPGLLPRYRIQGIVASWWFYGAARDSATRAVEQVMFARAAKRHDEAIATALALLHQGRLMRSGSESYSGVWTPLRVESQVFNSAQLPPRNSAKRARRVYVRPGFPFSTFTLSTPLAKPTGNLPLYLKEQGRRADLARLAGEWNALAPYYRAVRSYPWIDEQIPSQIARLYALERGCRLLMALVVPTLIWGVLAMLGAWVWRRHAPTPGTLSWPLCWAAALLMALSVGALDASWWWQNPAVQATPPAPLDQRLSADYGLISHAPLALWLWPLVLLAFFAGRAATRGQLAPRSISLRRRFREVLSPADELAAFDLSPLMGIFTSLVAWSSVLGVLAWAGYNWPPRSSNDFAQIGETGALWGVIFAFVIGGFFVVRWARRPHKRAALAAWFGAQTRLSAAFLSVLIVLFWLGHFLTIADERAFERALQRELSGQTFREWRASKKFK